MSLDTVMELADLAEAYRKAWREQQEAIGDLQRARARLDATDEALRAAHDALLRFMEEPPP